MSTDLSGTRRDLLRGAAVTMGAASYSRVMGANDKLRYGIIGAGDRGQHDMDLFTTNSNVEVAAVCDVYAAKIDQVKTKHPNAKSYKDHRALLEQKDLDIVQVTTPDHWHAVCAIDALNAGKDVYCEKPLTLKMEEGPNIVKAARVNERICQVGMQQRSGKHYLQAKAEYIDSGKIGKVTLCRTWWHGNTYHLRKAPASLATRPSNLDWAHFLGPLKWRDYDPQQYFNWRAYLDFGGGQVTDLFTHWIDVVHMFMGQDIPFSAASTTTRTAAPRPTPSTYCCSIPAITRPLLRPRSLPVSAARRSKSAAPRGVCSSTAATSNSSRWAAARSPRSSKSSPVPTL